MRHRATIVAASFLAVILTGGLALRGASAQNTTVTEIRTEISGVAEGMNAKKQERAVLLKQADKFRAAINSKRKESASIEDEIGFLDSNIARTQLDIEIANDEIQLLADEIKALNGKISENEKRLATQRELMGTLARKLYRAQFSHSPLEALLSGQGLAAFFDRLQSVTDLQAGVTKAATAVKEVKNSLAEESRYKEEKQLAVEDQKRSLEVARREQEDARLLKESLLIETKSSELEFRYALSELEKEQADADAEIRYLERVLREKQSLLESLSRGGTTLTWPVDPSRGISSIFHDPDYPFRKVLEHSGIDIRAYQGTPVRAAAAGIVAVAKNAGMGYSYVMLIHAGDLSTVYGHISKIAAKADAYVERGEIIGYSGGMPGTPGAGRLTTGPHLHFEVRERGVPTNPLKFLPAL